MPSANTAWGNMENSIITQRTRLKIFFFPLIVFSFPFFRFSSEGTKRARHVHGKTVDAPRPLQWLLCSLNIQNRQTYPVCLSVCLSNYAVFYPYKSQVIFIHKNKCFPFPEYPFSDATSSVSALYTWPAHTRHTLLFER